MTALDFIATAGESLRANALRTVLTTLGIMIGVAAVIAMVAVGAGAERKMEDLIRRLGSNILIVLNGTSVSGGRRGGSGTAVSLTEDDARAIEREVPQVAIAAAAVRGAAQVVYGNANWFTTIRGANQNYLDARDWVVTEGRRFSAADERGAGKVAILGSTVVDKVFDGLSPLGRTIRIKKVPFTVVGVTATKGQTPFGSDQDDVVFIPIGAAKTRVLGGGRFRGKFVGSIIVKARSAAAVTEAERGTVELLRHRHRVRPGFPDDFRVRNIAQILETRAVS
ncbi:MAG: ABC transporter permease, partial [bacterium]